MKNSGLADTAYFGAEAEFFIFDEVRYNHSSNACFHLVDSSEGHWNSGREEMLRGCIAMRIASGNMPINFLKGKQLVCTSWIALNGVRTGHIGNRLFLRHR